MTESTAGSPDATMSSRRLLVGYVEHRLRRQCLAVPAGLRDDVPPSKTGHADGELRPILASLGDEFEARYAEVFNETCAPLKLTPGNVEGTLLTILDHLFEGGVNWGRVVAIFAFCGALVAKCVENGMESVVVEVVDINAQYIDNKLKKWIDSNGGWEGLSEFHRNRNERRNENGDWSWPCFSSLCSYIFSATGMVTLTAVLTRK